MRKTTTRERFLRTFHFKEVDRPPNFEMGFWGQTLERFVKEGMPRVAATYSADGTDSCIDAFYGHPFFGLERQDHLPIRLGPIPPYERVTIKEDDRYEIFRDERGVLRKVLKNNIVRGTRSSMDQYLDFPVKTREDFEAMKDRYDPKDPSRYPADWRLLARRYRKRDWPLSLDRIGMLGFYGLGRSWMGTKNLSKAFFMQPDLVHDMFDFIADFIIEISRLCLRHIEVDCFHFFEDFAYNNGPLISPHIFEEFMLPRYKRVTEFLRNRDVDIIFLDSDGNTEVLLPLLIGAGITVHWPLEVASGMDPRRIREQYGRRLALMGGLDKRQLARGKKAIESEVLTKIPELVSEGGYVPMIDHIIPPEVSYESFLFYLEIKKLAMEQ